MSKKLMQHRYKAAVIGCGRIASGFDSDPKRKYVATHIGAYTRSKRIELVAVCDQNGSTLKACLKKWHINKGYLDYKELLAKEEPAIVSICTHPQSHLAIIKEALKQKSVKAIFCEKPIAKSSRGVANIIRKCQHQGIILQIDHQRRFDPLHRQLKDKIAVGAFGAPQRAVFHYTAGLENTGTHMFDLLCFLFGLPQWVCAVDSLNPSYKADDPNLDGMVQFKSGLIVSFGACDVKQYLVFELDCFCHDARFILTSSGFNLHFFKKGPSPYFSGYQEMVKAKVPFQIKYQRNFMVNAVNHLLGCIPKGSQSISSGEDGLMALRLIEAARHSAKHQGKRVMI